MASSTPAPGESVLEVPLGELSSGFEQDLGSISKRQPSFSDTPRQSIKFELCLMYKEMYAMQSPV